ncbi:MAG: hypothetical protein WCC74_01440 [Minisyncoccia bacterium]
MKKYFLALAIIFSLIYSVPFFAKAVEKELSNLEVANYIKALIAVGAITEDKVGAANIILKQLTDTTGGSGGATSITLLSPNSGGKLMRGQVQKIKWQDNRRFITTNYYDIYLDELCLYESGSCESKMIASKVTAGLYDWAVDEYDGLYKIKICDHSSDTNKQCSPSSNFFYISSPTPSSHSASAFVSCVANPSRVPIGGSVSWSAVIDGGAGGYSYTWSDNEGSSNIVSGTAGQTVTKVYNTAGIKTATLTVNDSAGNNASVKCNTSVYDPIQSQENFAPLQVSCFSDVTTVYLGPKHLPLAKGGNIFFTAKTSGGNGGYNYYWSDTDGDEGSAGFNLLKVYTTPGKKTMVVKVTSGTETVTKSCNFNVVDIPPPPLIVSCSGTISPSSNKTVIWGANASGGSKTSEGRDNYGYLWWLPNAENAEITTDKFISKTYTTTGNVNATLKVYSGDQVGNASCSVDMDSVSTPLSATCSASPSTINLGQSITWTAHPVGGAGEYSYSWGDSEGSIGLAGQSVSRTYNSVGEKGAVVLMASTKGPVGGNLAIATCSALVKDVDIPDPNATSPLSATCSLVENEVRKTSDIRNSPRYLNLVAYPKGGTGNYTYKWIEEGHGEIGNTSKSVPIEKPASGVRDFILEVNDGTQSTEATCSTPVE